MSEAEGRTGAVIAVLAGATVLGLTPIWMRLSELGPQATNFWRFALAVPVLGLLAAATRPNPTPKQAGLLMAGGALFGFELSLWGAALFLTTVTNATLLANMTPLFAAGLGWLLFKERLTSPILIGASVALVGAVLLAFGRAQTGQGPGSAEQGWQGDAISLFAASGYAGYLLIVRSLRGQVSIGAVMFFSSLSAAAYALCVSLIVGESLWPQTAQGWALLLAMGLITQAGAQGFIAWGVGRLPIAISTPLLWLQPLSAAVLSWIMFDESLGALALFGAALILGGVFVVQRSRQ